MVENAYASALYRQAKIGLNLYRSCGGWGPHARRVDGDSLSPRAYELAACGAFHLSAFRAEVPEIFGDLVPTFTTPAEAETLIRRWLPDAAGRLDRARQLPRRVAAADWVTRSRTILGDLRTMFVPTRTTRRTEGQLWLGIQPGMRSCISRRRGPARRVPCSG